MSAKKQCPTAELTQCPDCEPGPGKPCLPNCPTNNHKERDSREYENEQRMKFFGDTPTPDTTGAVTNLPSEPKKDFDDAHDKPQSPILSTPNDPIATPTLDELERLRQQYPTRKDLDDIDQILAGPTNNSNTTTLRQWRRKHIEVLIRSESNRVLNEFVEGLKRELYSPEAANQVIKYNQLAGHDGEACIMCGVSIGKINDYLDQDLAQWRAKQ